MAFNVFKTALVRIERRLDTAPSTARPLPGTRAEPKYLYTMIITKTEETAGIIPAVLEFIGAADLVVRTNETETEFQAVLAIKGAGTLINYLREHSGRIVYDTALSLATDLSHLLYDIEETASMVVPYIIPNNVAYLTHQTTGVTTFVYLGVEMFLPDKDDAEMNDYVIDLPALPAGVPPAFLSPELRDIPRSAALPIKVSSAAWVYSFAQNVIYSLSGNLEIKTKEASLKALEPIENTKLGFALARCLDEVPNKRVYLYV